MPNNSCANNGNGPRTQIKAVAERGQRLVNDTKTSAPSIDLSSGVGRTDTANASRFVDRFGGELLYVPPWKKWLVWDGKRWIDDSGVGVQQRAIRYAKGLWNDVEILSQRLSKDDFMSLVAFVRATNQAPKIASFLKLAQSDPRVVCAVDELNTDPLLLNCVNGTIDLKTGVIRPHNPADRLTQITNVEFDPNAVCPKWEETLSLIFDGNASLIRYVQRLLGYSLSGSTGEHILPISYGSGFNGKSTLWNTTADLLGDYAYLANDDLLLGDKSNHPTEKAALYQKRFVAISEPERGSQLKESRVKELTGDRYITARGMNENFWTFQRTHTFWISSNHLPKITGTDDGIWRRVKLIPFVVDLREKVKPVPDFDKWLVKHEGPGILAWLVRGFLDYQEHGLQEPKTITEATGKYRGDSDTLGEFLAEYTVDEVDAEVTASELFKAFSEPYGGRWNQTTFGKAMAERYTKTKSRRAPNRGKTIYQGIRLRTEKDDESDDAVPVGTSSDTGSVFIPIAGDQPPNWYQPVPSTNPSSDECDLGVAF